MGLERFLLKRCGLRGVSFRRCTLYNWPSTLCTPSISAVLTSTSDLQPRTFCAWNVGNRTGLGIQFCTARVGQSIPPLTQFIREVQVAAVVGDGCVKPLEGDSDGQAAAAALQAYLQKTAKLYLSDAIIVVDNAPSFLAKLTAIARQSQPAKQGIDNLDFRRRVETFLEENGLNGLEPVLESLGIVPDKLEALLPKLSTEQGKIQGLICTVKTFQRLGIPRSNIGELIEMENKVFLYTDDDLQNGIRALRELQISEEDMANLIVKCPLIFRPDVVNNIGFLLEELSVLPAKDDIVRKAILDNPRRVQKFCRNGARAVVQCLRNFGLSGTRVNKILLRHFRLVLSDLEKELMPKVQFLKDLGVPIDQLPKIINRCPGFLFLDVQEGLIPRLEYFRSLGLDSADFAKMIIRYPAIFSASLENKIKPVVTELKTLGLDSQSFRKILVYRPSLFAYKLGGDVSKLVEDLSKLNCSEKKKVTAFIKLFSRGMEHRKKCEDCLVQHGLSLSEAKEVLEKEPDILGYNEHSLSLKIENLTKTLGVPIRSLVSVPEYLSFQFRKRILRRQRVLSYLKSKDLLVNMVTLKHMISLSNKQFYKLYVNSHPEDLEVYKIWWKNKSDIGQADNFDFIEKFPEDYKEVEMKS